MGKLKELNTTTNIVKEILEEYPETRNSDNVLYVKFCKIVGKEKGIDIEKMSMVNFLLHLKELGMPSIETVGRCRRKIVEKNPELAGNDVVEYYKEENEKAFKKYAKGY